MENKRLNRAAEAYQHELASILLFDTRDQRLQDVGITRVVFAPDMKLAKIYFRVAGGKVREREVQEGFKKAEGYLKRELATRVNLKFAPDLRFYYDDAQEAYDHIDRLLHQIEVEKNAQRKKD